jgi:CopG antitoxin of type II toxin-antitoxin system
MVRNRKRGEPVPKHFESVEQAGQFWDTHDLADYWELTREAEFDVDLERRVFLTTLELRLAGKLTAAARKQGISTETLINLWLTEKVEEATEGK